MLWGQLLVPLSAGEIVLYTGREEENIPHTEGVTLFNCCRKHRRGLVSLLVGDRGRSWFKNRHCLLQNQEDQNERHTDSAGGVHPFGGVEDHFSHPRVRQDRICLWVHSWLTRPIRACKALWRHGRGIRGVSGRGLLALAFLACLCCSDVAVLLVSHLMEPL